MEDSEREVNSKAVCAVSPACLAWAVAELTPAAQTATKLLRVISLVDLQTSLFNAKALNCQAIKFNF